MTTGIILLAALLNAGPVPTPEPRLLVDTDMLTDCDDVAARAPGGEADESPCNPLGPDDALHVQGNRIVNAVGEEVWLQGVAIPSLEWLVGGEHVRESFERAITDWRVNVIRLPLRGDYWFGRGKEAWNRRTDGGAGYRALVDELVGYANERGCYVVLDLHEFKAATEHHAEFWRDCAKRYANRPGVLFDLLNEPHGISWKEWRDGGDLEAGGGKDEVDENEDCKKTGRSIGMQRLVEDIRSTGAKNVLVCGGIDWAYDCSGVLKGFALSDPSGDGIMYSVHVYPWKSGWRKKFLAVAEKYPLFLGEVGCQPDPMPFEHEAVDPYSWAPDILSCIRKNRLNWTAWSFHVSARPCVLADWQYRPTPYWGAFVRAALRGVSFESDRLR